MTMDTGPDCGHHQGGRDDEQGQPRRGHGDQRVEEVRPDMVSLVTSLYQRHHPEHMRMSARGHDACDDSPGRVNAGVRHHVVLVHDGGEHVLDQGHHPGHCRPRHQEQGDEQLLGE